MGALLYGLTAAVWTNDIKRAIKAARRVQSGCVWINGVGNYFKGTPYGGLKNSGIGIVPAWTLTVPVSTGLPPAYPVRDLLTDADFTWRIGRNYVKLGPGQSHVLKIGA